jgi:leader peptidase (prepilin peptidase) / N-methyltransferase
MGMGDIKFAAVLGFFLGWKMVLLSLFLGSIYAVFSMIILSLLNKIKLNEYLPFGPFIAAGAITFTFYGIEIIKWYQLLLFPASFQFK